MFFDLYWRILGLPLSRAKGWITDAVPFSVVEASLWVGTASVVALALSFLFPRSVFARKDVRVGAILMGPVFLIALSLGQGAFPLSIAPTGLRQPLTERLAPRPLDSAAFKEWTRAREDRLRAYFAPDNGGWEAFQSLSEDSVLAACDVSLDSVLSTLGLPPGRTVRAYKDMGPLTSTLGLLYGGPAFHDPFFGEIGIIPYRTYPVSHYWRLMAACHEAAHAKGYTREMDAEILTQLSLLRMEDSRYRALSDIHFLLKTGTKITWPDSLVAEARRAGAARDSLRATRPVLRRVKSWMQKSGVQNSAVKYGTRRQSEAWNPLHPFFATVRTAQEKF